MSLAGAAFPFARSRSVWRSVVVVAGVALIGVMLVGNLSRSGFAGAVGHGISEGINGLETVAAMLAERSPGQRPEGALAQLKHKRAAALHERALPKVRGPAPSAYEALAGPAPTLPSAPLHQAPLYTAVAGGPTPLTPPVGGPSGGPPILSDIPPAGGGGGGFTPPPTVTTLEVPPFTPVTPVPEPASWAMMLIGFGGIGLALRRCPKPLSRRIAQDIIAAPQ